MRTSGWYLGSRSVVLCVMYALAGPARMLMDAWMRPRTNQEHNALAGGRLGGLMVRVAEPPVALCGGDASARRDPGSWLADAGGAPVSRCGSSRVALYNVADAIDSVSHVFGRKLEPQHDESRNSG